MPRKLVISDANILIDMECGDLLAPMFRLDCEFAVPDILYDEELSEHHPHVIELGLGKIEVGADGVEYVERIVPEATRRGISRNDLFALALARQEDCLLLTGDSRLRILAEEEGCQVHGTIWLIGELVQAGRVRLPRVKRAYDAMRAAGRRLPQAEIEAQLRELESDE